MLSSSTILLFFISFGQHYCDGYKSYYKKPAYSQGSSGSWPSSYSRPPPTTYSSPSPPKPQGCICPLVYAPVCGSNGKTYDNPCYAKCDLVGVQCEGNCPCSTQGCNCIEIFDPVCGFDGKTYSNSCVAELCKRQKVRCKGKCPCGHGCSCSSEIYAPVCTSDGKTYENKCLAKCKGQKVKCEGRCPCKPTNQCICPQVYDPVCGSDGETYGNGCMANCQGQTVDCKGQCPCKNDICDCCGDTFPLPKFCSFVDILCYSSCPGSAVAKLGSGTSSTSSSNINSNYDEQYYGSSSSAGYKVKKKTSSPPPYTSGFDACRCCQPYGNLSAAEINKCRTIRMDCCRTCRGTSSFYC